MATLRLLPLLGLLGCGDALVVSAYEGEPIFSHPRFSIAGRAPADAVSPRWAVFWLPEGTEHKDVSSAVEQVGTSRPAALSEGTLSEAQSSINIARLAQGVAHQVNNPATALLANLEHLERTEALSEEGQSIVGECVDAVRSISAIVRGLRRYGLSQALVPEPIELRSLVMQALAEAPLEGIETKLEVPAGLWITGDRGWLLLVLGNLLHNAVLALGETAQPRITMAARVAAEVSLEVVDNGCGMDRGVARRACEPFFTTRAPGEGCGLGLSMAREIAVRHDGRLQIVSRPGKGTRAVLTLPLPDAEPGSITALLVSSDPQVRREVQFALRGFAHLTLKTVAELEAPVAADLCLFDLEVGRRALRHWAGRTEPILIGDGPGCLEKPVDANEVLNAARRATQAAKAHMSSEELGSASLASLWPGKSKA